MKFKTSKLFIIAMLAFSVSAYADKTETNTGSSTATATADPVSISGAISSSQSGAFASGGDVSNVNVAAPVIAPTTVVSPITTTTVAPTTIVAPNIDPRITGTNTNAVTVSPRIDTDVHNTNLVNTSSGVVGSGNSFNHLGQHQNQNQSNSNSLDNIGNSSSNSSATGGSSSSDASSTNNVAGSKQTQQANNTGNTQNITTNNPKQHNNTPSMANFVPMPTSPCMATIGGAGAGAGFGFSISGSYINENCEIIETAKAMAFLGQPQAGMEVICLGGKHGNKSTLCQNIIREHHARLGTKTEVVAMSKEVNQKVEDEVAMIESESGGGFKPFGWLAGLFGSKSNNVANAEISSGTGNSAQQVTTVAVTNSNYASSQQSVDLNKANPWGF